jgi:two-component system, LytTR family, response regulator
VIRVLIIDDEPLARRGVRVCLRRAGDVMIVGEADSGEAALEKLVELRPDLVFLDVQMPGMDGFEMLLKVDSEKLPLIIFLTAYDTYALEAFGVHALDYLMKPIDDERFDEALRTARKRLHDMRAGEQLASKQGLLPAHEASSRDAWQARFEVKSGGRTFWVSTDDIDWIEASGDYVILHVGHRIHMVHGSMDGIEQRLDPSGFARIHRSTIVSLDRVTGLSLLSTRDAVLTLKDGTELRVSRRFRHRLRPDMERPAPSKLRQS